MAFVIISFSPATGSAAEPAWINGLQQYLCQAPQTDGAVLISSSQLISCLELRLK
jgi:hypothetical protein